MIVTPLITPIKNGQLVTFSSSLEDMNAVFNAVNPNRRFAFSKYALLRLPDILRDGYTDSNTIFLKAIESHYLSGLSSHSDGNYANTIDISNSLQNYVLNMESVILSGSDYDKSTNINVAERVFWKWMKEIGAIRFAKSDNIITEESQSDVYNTVVQYIGNIDHQGVSNGTTNIIINIPTTTGNTIDVQFNSIADKNYNESSIFISKSGERINGATNHQYDLSINAVYDGDIAGQSLVHNTNGDNNSYWYKRKKSSAINAYYTDEVFGDVSNDKITRSTAGRNIVTYNRSRMDGTVIDWDLSHYKKVVDYNNNHTDKIVTLSDYNNIPESKSFDFNVILLYYDTYDVSNPSDVATNLYGVFFVGDIKQTNTNTATITTTKKIKQDNYNGLAGNGIGFKLNFQFGLNGGQANVITDGTTDNAKLMILDDAINLAKNIAKQCELLIKNNIDLSNRLKSVTDFSKHIPKISIPKIQLATADSDGLMSKEDKKKLSQLESSSKSDNSYKFTIRTYPEGLATIIGNNVYTLTKDDVINHRYPDVEISVDSRKYCIGNIINAIGDSINTNKPKNYSIIDNNTISLSDYSRKYSLSDLLNPLDPTDNQWYLELVRIAYSVQPVAIVFNGNGSLSSSDKITIDNTVSTIDHENPIINIPALGFDPELLKLKGYIITEQKPSSLTSKTPVITLSTNNNININVYEIADLLNKYKQYESYKNLNLVFIFEEKSQIRFEFYVDDDAFSYKNGSIYVDKLAFHNRKENVQNLIGYNGTTYSNVDINRLSFRLLINNVMVRDRISTNFTISYDDVRLVGELGINYDIKLVPIRHSITFHSAGTGQYHTTIHGNSNKSNVVSGDYVISAFDGTDVVIHPIEYVDNLRRTMVLQSLSEYSDSTYNNKVTDITQFPINISSINSPKYYIPNWVVKLESKSYFGVITDEVDIPPVESVITGLTLLSESRSGVGLTITFTMPYGRCVYAYPKSLGQINSIIDKTSGWNITNSFSVTELTVGGVPYYCYYLTDPVEVDNYSLQFS